MLGLRCRLSVHLIVCTALIAKTLAQTTTAGRVAYGCAAATGTLRTCPGSGTGVACSLSAEAQLVQTLVTIGLPCLSTSGCTPGSVCATYGPKGSPTYCYALIPPECSPGVGVVSLNNPAPPGYANYWYERVASGNLTTSKPLNVATAEAIIEGATGTIITLTPKAAPVVTQSTPGVIQSAPVVTQSTPIVAQGAAQTSPVVSQGLYTIYVDCPSNVPKTSCVNNVKSYISGPWAAAYGLQTGQSTTVVSLTLV